VKGVFVRFDDTTSDGSLGGDRLAIPPYDTQVLRYFRSTIPYWEQIYEGRTVYSQIYQERARRAIAYLDHVELSGGAPVLEVGCGPGVITVAMARKGLTVSAIDNVPEMVERTRVMAQRAGLGSLVSARTGHTDRLPFADASFELVMVIGVSEWLASLMRPLQEIVRVLRPGGHLIISADNNWALHQIIDPMLNPALKPIKACIGKILRSAGLRTLQPRFHAYSLRQFDRELTNSGLEKIASETFGFGPFTLCNRRLLNEDIGWRLHLSLQRLADTGVPLLRSAGLVYLVLARKTCPSVSIALT
jgi:ubiquinone/menaquinone biosynthesis C-methylase UbiE